MNDEIHRISWHRQKSQSNGFSDIVKIFKPPSPDLEAIVLPSQKYLIKSVLTWFRENYQKIGLKMTYRCYQMMKVEDQDSNLLVDLGSQNGFGDGED